MITVPISPGETLRCTNGGEEGREERVPIVTGARTKLCRTNSSHKDVGASRQKEVSVPRPESMMGMGNQRLLRTRTQDTWQGTLL